MSNEAHSQVCDFADDTSQNKLREALKKKTGNSLVFYQTRGGGVPPNQTISRFFSQNILLL